SLGCQPVIRVSSHANKTATVARNRAHIAATKNSSRGCLQISQKQQPLATQQSLSARTWRVNLMDCIEISS
ncbi:MAG: hypothetical protein ACREFR_06430, partial [Limisphaerales bacterium]